MSLNIPADAEQIVTSYLRTVTDVTDIAAGIGTELPSAKVWPFVRVTRVGGGEQLSVSHLDAPVLQFDVWGGTQFEARQLAATISAAIDQIDGYAAHGGYVTGADTGSFRTLPDEDFTPVKPRYVFDAIVYVHPAD